MHTRLPHSLSRLCCALGLGLVALAPTAQAQTPVAAPASPLVQQALQAVRAAAPVQQVLDDLKADHPRTIEELRTLTAIPRRRSRSRSAPSTSSPA